MIIAILTLSISILLVEGQMKRKPKFHPGKERAKIIEAHAMIYNARINRVARAIRKPFTKFGEWLIPP